MTDIAYVRSTNSLRSILDDPEKNTNKALETTANETNKKKGSKKDGGYAWVVLIGAFEVFLCIGGTEFINNPNLPSIVNKVWYVCNCCWLGSYIA